jgi:hypothetical protein
MFKLVAVLFMLASPDEPVTAMSYNQQKFATAKECELFVGSRPAAITQIKSAAKTQAMGARFVCVETEDNSI